ncbi:unnamed protein product [Phytophthora fragariaefolia]|uniref:Unnamed protein product n=1 Tax=Phytophthora fragariaefolia TaxID=1490495 RepID=A0A9W6TV37_9STRA|nr:unnamed protein product [Phytophthora fragariaefolia]
MDAASSATESVMTGGQKSLYPFHAMLETWKHDLNVWKDRREYIPYNELKLSIEENDRPSEDNRKKFTQESRESGMIAVTVNTSMPVSLAAQATVSPEPSWTIHSGCTRHVTHEARWFTTSGSITVGGENTTPVEGTGQVEMEVTDSKGKKKTLILHDVLFAPQLKFILFSVPAAVKHDFRFSFDRKKCAVQIAARFKIKAMMANHTDLYQFQATPAVKTKVLIAKSGRQSSMMLLRKRLGHPNARTLHHLPRNQTITGLDEEAVNPRAQFFCTVCTLAKSHRSPFNSNRIVEHVQYSLEKVHTDIGGPSPVPSLTGCRYFRIFIDDFSRNMFAYSLTSRSQVYECYEDFRRKALNIFRRDVNVLEYPRPSEVYDSQPNPQSSMDEWEIQVLQADNAKEYEKLGRKPVSHPRPEQTEIRAPPSATTTSAALPILPPLRGDIKPSHYTLSEETPNESFAPTNKKPRLDLTATEVTVDAEDDLREREQRKTLLYTLLSIRYVTVPTTY